MNLLHSTILGEGNPLIILHGYFGMSDNWKSLGKQFSQHYEVHLIDQRNHGRSFHSNDFDYELMTQDLYHYVEQHQLKTINILGHSMGGKTAMLFAVTYPQKVNSLLVADISPKFYKPHHQEILEALNAVNFSIHNTRKKVEEVLSICIKDAGIRQFLLKNVFWKEKNQLDYRFNLESLTLNNSEVGEALPPYAQYEGSCLFLKGGNSKYITKEDIPLIKAHFASAKIATIKNAGHWLHAENPVQFYNEVTTFLETTNNY